MFLFNSICKSHAYILKQYSLSRDSNNKLWLQEKKELEKIWVQSNRRLKLVAAPLIVTALFIIKTVVVNPSIKLSIDINPVVGGNIDNNLNKSLPFLAFIFFISFFFSFFFINN